MTEKRKATGKLAEMLIDLDRNKVERMGRRMLVSYYLHKTIRFIWCALLVISAIAVLWMLTGCRTRYVSVPEYHYVNTQTHDSVQGIHIDWSQWLQTIRQKDSVATHTTTTITKDAEGNVTSKETVKEINHYHSLESEIRQYRGTIDSLRHALAEKTVKVDSIRVPYPVEKQLPKWKQAMIVYGEIAMGVTAVAVVFIIVWLIRRFRVRVI